MSEEWKDTIRWVVYCAVIALVVLVFCTLLTSLRAECAANTALRTDLDTYKRANAEYSRRESVLMRDIAAAQDRASRAEVASREAQTRFEQYRAGVTERDRVVSERINVCLAELGGIDSSINRCIRLTDLCIDLDKLARPGTH